MYTVVIPTLNEYENLKELLPRLFNPDCEVIICDNGSTDGTQRLVKDAMANFNIRLSKGTGTVTDAILRGIKEARCDKIIVMDGDLCHPPEVVPKLVSALDEHDMVVGVRNSSNDLPVNRLVSEIGKLVTWFLAPGIPDRMSGFWGIRKSLAISQLPNIKRGIKPFLQFLVRCRPSSVGTIPYEFRKRVEGASTNKRFWSYSTLWDLALLHWVKGGRVLKYLIVGGTGVYVGTFVLWVLTDVVGLFYLVSAVLAIILANSNNFLWNNIWAFRGLGRQRPLSKRYSEFLVFYGATAALDIAFIWFLTSILGVYYIISFLVSVCSIAFIRFVLCYFWIWGKGFRGLSLNNLWNLGHSNEDGDFEWWEWYGPHFVKRKWKKRMGGYIKELAGNPGSILSLGCGSSPIINLFHCSRMGLDINEDKVDFIRKHSTATFAVVDITTMTLVETVDCILCNEVLEHLDPDEVGEVVRIISKGLVPGGGAVLSFPDYSNKRGFLSEKIMHRGIHRNGLTEVVVTNLCAEYGLVKIESRRYNWDTAILYRKENLGVNK